jgi:kynureninase
MEFEYTRDEAARLDAEDSLAAFRGRFVIDDPSLIYLDGNSLGRLPAAAADVVSDAVEEGWGKRLIESWNDGWIDLPRSMGAKIARVIGAREDEVVMTDSTSVNLFKLVSAALGAAPGRKVIVSDEFNFPSDLYVLQGIAKTAGEGFVLKLARSTDGITIDIDDLLSLIDTDTALVCLTQVAFKSGFMYDIGSITKAAHDAGATVLWDLSHSAGAVTVDLNAAGADLAVGCTYKYLNGGPGSPAYLCVRKDRQKELLSPIQGWFAAHEPFAFDLDFKPSAGISRFLAGTPPVLSMLAAGPGLDLVLEAGPEAIREKSVRLSSYLIGLAQRILSPLKFRLGSPENPAVRGSHVSLRHPEAFRICSAMKNPPEGETRVIPDFREPDNIRLGLAPLYNSYEEVYAAVHRISRIVGAGEFMEHSDKRGEVT